MIDYPALVAPATKFIKDAIADFSEASPDVEISTVGLCGNGFNGTITLHLDTPEQSEVTIYWLRQNKKEDFDHYTDTDKYGTFCTSCIDFREYVDGFDLPDFPDFSKDSSYPCKCKTITGDLVTITKDFGDANINRLIFPFLLFLLKQKGLFDGLNKSLPFRIGADVENGDPTKFWVCVPPKSKRRK